jgi:hypothetical protein
VLLGYLCHLHRRRRRRHTIECRLHFVLMMLLIPRKNMKTILRRRLQQLLRFHFHRLQIFRHRHRRLSLCHLMHLFHLLNLVQKFLLLLLLYHLHRLMHRRHLIRRLKLLRYMHLCRRQLQLLKRRIANYYQPRRCQKLIRLRRLLLLLLCNLLQSKIAKCIQVIRQRHRHRYRLMHRRQ